MKMKVIPAASATLKGKNKHISQIPHIVKACVWSNKQYAIKKISVFLRVLFALFSRILFARLSIGGALFFSSLVHAASLYVPPTDPDGTFTLTWTTLGTYFIIYERDPSGHTKEILEGIPGSGSKTFTRSPGTYRYYLQECTVHGPTPTCTVTPTYTLVIGPPLPTVSVSFSPTTVDEGGNSTLSWSSTNATSCSASGISGVSGTSGSTTYTGSYVDGTTMNKTVTITCSGAGGSVSKSATVTVRDIPAIITASTGTSTTGIYTVSWNYAKHAAMVYEKLNSSGSWGIISSGEHEPMGQLGRTKTVEGTYYYKVDDCHYGGPMGTRVCTHADSTQVVVNLPNPTVNASFNPTTISEGQSSTLTWSSSRATSCSASGISGVSGTSGSKGFTASSTMSANKLVTVTVTCTGNGGTTSKTVQLNINWINDKPTISDINNRSIYKNGSTGKLAFTVSDEETLSSSLQMSATSNNTTLVPVNGINFGTTEVGSNRTVKVTPAANQSGTATITLTVTDANNGTDSTTFDVTVSASEAPLTTTYRYDALGRLVKAIDGDGKETSYEYDAAGNRESETTTQP